MRNGQTKGCTGDVRVKSVKVTEYAVKVSEEKKRNKLQRGGGQLYRKQTTLPPRQLFIALVGCAKHRDLKAPGNRVCLHAPKLSEDWLHCSDHGTIQDLKSWNF